jgi:hypothetical protein
VRRLTLTLVLLGCGLLAGAAPAGLPAAGDFTLTRSTIDGGGGASAGGQFALAGTIGQPDASANAAAAAEWQLNGGFWAGLGDLLDLIFKDGFEDP